MAIHLGYLNQSRRLFKRILSDSYKQLHFSLATNFCVVQKVSDTGCLTDDVKIEEDFSDRSELVVKNPEVTSLSNSDKFGDLKVSLERQQRIKNQASQLQEFARKKGKTSSVHPSKTIKPNDFSNQFGSLTDDAVWYAEVAEPEKGGKNILFFPEDKKYRTPQAYLRQMKLLVKERKIKEALELFPDMRENKMYPNHANYTFMIGACGRVGYTEMAFQLLREMVSRKMRPTPATLTGLFNSCAECPFPEYGLKQIKILREKITEKNWLMSKPTYRAMIKAFGKCGDLLSAFQAVDEMIEAGIQPDIITYNFLLMSCISDKEAGFTHALGVWRKLRQKKKIPDEYTFNLLLRATRDCGIGPPEISDLLLQNWSSYIKRPYGLNVKEEALLEDVLKLPNPQLSMLENTTKQLTAGSVDASNKCNSKIDLFNNEDKHEDKKDSISSEITILSPHEVTTNDKSIVLTNLLSTRPLNGPTIIDLINIETASDRLALLGNAKGFLETMVKFKAKPDIKTFMLLLENSPQNIEAEEQLLSLMDTHKVKPDTDFFNIFIKRRNFRRDYTAAKQVLCLIYKYNLSPDIVTFGVLALGCHKKSHGQQLLREMKKIGYCANVEIMDTLIGNACVNNDLDYVDEILRTMKYHSIKPNEPLLKKIEGKLETLRKLVIDKEQKKVVPEWMTDNMCKQYYKFCNYYTKWLQHVQVDIEAHPWDQYKTVINVKDPDNTPMPLL